MTWKYRKITEYEWFVFACRAGENDLHVACIEARGDGRFLTTPVFRNGNLGRPVIGRTLLHAKQQARRMGKWRLA